MPTSVPNFNFLAARPQASACLYRALVLVNAYEFAKFLFPRLIAFGNIEGYQNKNVGRYGGRNHVCNMSVRGVGVVRGVSLPSPIDLTRRPTLVKLPYIFNDDDDTTALPSN